jgi:hypothetical protein
LRQKRILADLAGETSSAGRLSIDRILKKARELTAIFTASSNTTKKKPGELNLPILHPKFPNSGCQSIKK